MKENLMKEALEAIFDLTHSGKFDYTQPDVEVAKDIIFAISSLSSGVRNAVKTLESLEK